MFRRTRILVLAVLFCLTVAAVDHTGTAARALPRSQAPAAAREDVATAVSSNVTPLLNNRSAAAFVSTASSTTIHVDARANIFGAGHAIAPSPGGGNGGLLPPVATLPASAGQVVTLTNVQGIVSCCGGAGPNGPDGRLCSCTTTDITSYGGIAGIVDSRLMFLVGVFLDEAEPADPAPARLDFTASESFPELSPALRQTFFVGDGLTQTGSGAVQRFHVPAGATRLFLGFADASGFHGLPAYYEDNTGAIDATVNTEPPDFRLPWADNQAWYYYCWPHSTANGCGMGGSTESLDFGPTTRLGAPTCVTHTEVDTSPAHAIKSVGSGKVLARPGDWNAPGKWFIALGSWTGPPDARFFIPSGLAVDYDHVWVDPSQLPALGAEVSAGTVLGNPSCIIAPGGFSPYIHLHLGFFKCVASALQCADTTQWWRPSYSPVDLKTVGIALCGWHVGGTSLQRGTRIVSTEPPAAYPAVDGPKYRVACNDDTALPVQQQQTLFADGQTTDIAFDAVSGQAKYSGFASLDGSSVDVSFSGPGGVTIDATTQSANVTHVHGDTYDLFLLTGLALGPWVMHTHGTGIPAGGEMVSMSVGSCAQAVGDAAGDPCVADDDGDGLSDADEINVYHTDPLNPDTDADACGDAKELALAPPLDPANPWDFYSVPVPALFAAPDPLTAVRDNIIGAADAQAVFGYFKKSAKDGSLEYEQDLNGNGIKDGIEYDRSFAGPGMSGPPDGVVRAQDAQLAFAQYKFGYKC